MNFSIHAQLSGRYAQKRKPTITGIWELIDSGKVLYISWKRGLWAFEDYIHTLAHLLAAG